jgi:hypothetical protein
MFSLAMNYDCLFEYRKSIPLYKEIIEKYPIVGMGGILDL